MQLESFFPYRLAVAADAVSRSIAQVYGERFDLGRDEWRVLAALADAAMLRTSAVIERTTLDKVAVSRALARLEGRGLVERRTDPEDGRGYLIRLRTAGRAPRARRGARQGARARQSARCPRVTPAAQRSGTLQVSSSAPCGASIRAACGSSRFLSTSHQLDAAA